MKQATAKGLIVHSVDFGFTLRGRGEIPSTTGEQVLQPAVWGGVVFHGRGIAGRRKSLERGCA